MMSAKEASTLWGISTRRVTTLCSAGKIPGASKENGSWQIPANAEKPADARVRTGAYKKSAMPAHLPLPVGISDYRLASTEYYYVDKNADDQRLFGAASHGLAVYAPQTIRQNA